MEAFPPLYKTVETETFISSLKTGFINMLLKLLEGVEGQVDQVQGFMKLIMFSTSNLNCVVLHTNAENLRYILKLIT